MDVIAVRPPHRRAGRAALLSALAGIILAGLALRHWLADATAAAPDVLSGGAPVLLLGAALLCMLNAALLAHMRSAAMQSGVRDPDTGLYRRAYADEILPQWMARDDRGGHSELAALLLRVDYLDEIRRRYGIAGSERVLAAVGRLLSGQARGADLPVRYDDRQLVVFLHCAEAEQAVAFGRRIAMLLSAQQLEWRGDVIKVTASMGVALRRPGEPLDALLGRAAARLEEARAGGANRIAA
jgi:diguanylate cyclase (GGDEF)-like protein